ncbi:hypothetical protein P4O66_000112 [Electrophorus voltai]|uniref:Uncharacterized protein n=1 Tax=Electrophorus voltai TaxID=2609070 RepID=A0AAD8ZVU7_9TELE|nr:hypothetical protein P4O66_000112 [Electrophorus voltai]
MEQLPLEALSDMESEHSVDSYMEVEASPVPKPMKGTHHSKAYALPCRASRKVQVSSGMRCHRVVVSPRKSTKTVMDSTVPETVAGGSSGEPRQEALPGMSASKAGVPSSPKQATLPQPAMGVLASTRFWSAMGLPPAVPLGNISHVPVTVTVSLPITVVVSVPLSPFVSIPLPMSVPIPVPVIVLVPVVLPFVLSMLARVRLFGPLVSPLGGGLGAVA